MNEQQIIERAIAVRMACSIPAEDGNGRAQPVIAVFADGVATAQLSGGAPKTLSYPAGMPPRELAEAISADIGSSGAVPSMVALGKTGAFAVGPTGSRAYGILSASADAGMPAASGRMRGVVVLVTGSAQGFGKGIAELLADEGACVMVADINDTNGKAVARAIDHKHGRGTAAYCRADVMREDSLQACAAAAVRAFGGIDMLISNAGILKAGGLDEMRESDFDLVTNVNYKGYFLAVKSVAPIMKTQREYNQRHSMDIIQINSKSGLSGSEKNFAYAGGKFGGIGLTQSFALELINHGIKVNAICPGNYFDGPLWSDPRTGLFAQYLKTGKVKGARTTEDVKDHYMSKIPMKRGCTPRDVVTAILYLRDQEYETGQALPVTGGQIMLS